MGFYKIIISSTICVILLLLVPEGLHAQNGFGFDDSGFGFSAEKFSSFSVKIGGEIRSNLRFYYNEMGSTDAFQNLQPGDFFSGSLNFQASYSFAQAITKLDWYPVADGSTPPIKVDEGYLRAFFGPVTIEAGLRKLTWGKADSFGPLDVINPLDFSDMSRLSDPLSIKIARPMLRATWSLGSFSRVEGVFIPWFQGHQLATSGRWAPNQITALVDGIDTVLYMTALSHPDLYMYIDTIRHTINSLLDNIEDFFPKTNSLELAQAGLRFTTSIGASDIGIQYFFGRNPRPTISGINPAAFLDLSMPSDDPNALHPEALIPEIRYNYYHQIGVDFARVIAGYNIRAELGVNITKDLDGTDGTVENPAFVWSLGFDRDLFWGINLNLQATGQIRLFHNRIRDSIFADCEAGSNLSSTRITGVISRKFMREALEIKVTGLWGIEEKDFLIMPAVVWSRNNARAELSIGFFGGNRSGELGQYRDNSFFRMNLSYSF